MLDGNHTPGHSLPDFDRLSVLAAAIMLALVLARFAYWPVREFAIQLPGVYLAFQLNRYTVIALLTAGLTASGVEWLLRDHPGYAGRIAFQHWLLPALTACVVGITLFLLPFGVLWIGTFAVGGLLLIMVLIAEYIVIDPEDLRYALAAAGLTAVSFALFLILAIVLRAAGARLLWTLPALSFASGLVSLRTLHLRSPGIWQFVPAVLIALVAGQLTAAFHYWPLSPISFGLAVLGPTYSLTTFISALAEDRPKRFVMIEPSIVLFLTWGLMLWIR